MHECRGQPGITAGIEDPARGQAERGVNDSYSRLSVASDPASG
jgi:hypothetical protein